MPDDLPTNPLGFAAKIGLAASVGALGCCGLAFTRRLQRVREARWRLQELIAATAGREARIVITGATNGIGEELARQFLLQPSTALLLGCRDVRRAERLFGSASSGSRARVVALELLDFDSVQSFSNEAHDFLKGGNEGLRLIFNNAGVMKPPDSKTFLINPTWQTNFVAPFLMTELLSRRREECGAQAKLMVVNVSSRLERRSKLDEQLLSEVRHGEVGQAAYGDSKRGLMLWTASRAQTLQQASNTYLSAATPGMVDSQLGRYSVHPWLWPLTKPLRMFLLRSAAEGALSVAEAPLSLPAAQCAGKYFDGAVQLEDLVQNRSGHKVLADEVVKWASAVSELERRSAGVGR